MTQNIDTVKLLMPEAEELLLPSLGLSHGIRSLWLRPMTLQEERMLTNKTLAKQGKVHDTIFNACITHGTDVDGKVIPKEKINIDDLYVEDEFAIFIFLRQISYGNDYEVTLECPHCNTGREQVINLEADLNVTFAETDEAGKIITPETDIIELPKSKTKVKFHWPKKKDSNRADGDSYAMIPYIIDDADGVPEVILDEWVKRLIGLDVSVIRKAIQKTPFGLSKDVSFVCKNSECSKHNETQEVALPITAEFFRI